MRTLKQVLPEVFNEKCFEIPMPDNSTTEVWADLTTGLMPDMAWLIWGWEWLIEGTDPTQPTAVWPNTDAVNSYQIQLQRNIDSEIMLKFTDSDVIFTDKFVVDVLGAAASLNFDTPMTHEKNHPTPTTSRKMRMMFRSATDDTAISSPAATLRGKIFYEVISLNEQDYVKHGNILRL